MEAEEAMLCSLWCWKSIAFFLWWGLQVTLHLTISLTTLNSCWCYWWCSWLEMTPSFQFGTWQVAHFHLREGNGPGPWWFHSEDRDKHLWYSGLPSMGKEGDFLCPVEADLSVWLSAPIFFTCGKLSRLLPRKLSCICIFQIPARCSYALRPHRKI